MVIDIILILFALAGFWLGYTKGVVATLFSVLSYVVAMIITLVFSPWLSGLLIRTFHMNHLMALILGTLLFFIASIFLIIWLSKKIENFLKKGKLSGSNKILGGMVMLIVGIAFYSLVLWVINDLSLLNDKIKSTSISYPTLQAIPEKAGSFVLDFKHVFQRYWELLQESVKENKTSPPG